MKKYLLALLLALSSTAWAHRFPIDSMEVAVLKSASFPQVTLITPRQSARAANRYAKNLPRPTPYPNQ